MALHAADRVFCKHCALMIPMHYRKDKGAFVNKPFINWRNLQEKAKRHEQIKYRRDAMIATASLACVQTSPRRRLHAG